MSSWLWLPLGFAALWALAWAHLAFWTRFYTRPFLPDERHMATCADGLRVAVARLRPNPSGPAKGAPVLCCHGLACNARFFDFQADRSLGRFLANLGFDVFLIDLRGAGASERGGRGREGFYEYVHQDVPAALALVRQLTGARRVLWVGHSMGGLIGYEQMAAGTDELAAMVALGSPLSLVSIGERGVSIGAELRFSVRLLRSFGRLLPVIPFGKITRFLAPLAGHVRLWPEHVFLNPKGVSGKVLRHFMVEVLNDVPRPVLDELATRLLDDASAGGRPMATVRDALARSPVPTLVLAGSIDRIAPVAACDVDRYRSGLDHEWGVLSAAAAGLDFGHLDLVLGDAAPTHVYGRVGGFLLARAARCESPAP